jgi:ribA/ribD-fused uncharacterized protein
MKYNKIIDSFQGGYRWLSNFYPFLEHLTVEHFYQASKATNKTDFNKILNAADAYECKKLSKTIIMRTDWSNVKYTIMHELIKYKFSINDELCQKLIDTKGTLLIEGNTWGDTYWGVCNNIGNNNLGRILMDVRDNFL